MNTENKLPELPQGWVWTEMGEIVTPSAEKSSPQNIQRVPYIGLEHIEKDTGKLCGLGYSDDVRSTKACFHRGDLLYGKLRPYLNKVYLAEFDGVCSTDILVFPSNPFASGKFLFYRLLSQDFVMYANQNISGVQHPRVNYQVLSRFSIAFPPLPEQHRIVSRLEELFTRLDAGVEALHKVQAQLKRYRQAVLNAAVRGELTREWREEHRGEIEPAEVMLERIREERRVRGLKEVAGVDVSGLPEVPEGWGWAKVEELNPASRTCAYGVLQPGSDVENGTLLVRVGDINDGRIQIDGMKRIDSGIAAQYSRTKLQGGEVLITLVGAIGRTAVVPPSLAGANVARAVGVIPLVEHIVADWVEIWFRNPAKTAEMTAKAHEVARKTLNLEDVRSAILAIPPISEQQRIIDEVGRRLSIADKLETALTQSLSRASSLRQSILQRAFAGKLVPQDPGDEPAEGLLERMREGMERKGRQMELWGE